METSQLEKVGYLSYRRTAKNDKVKIIIENSFYWEHTSASTIRRSTCEAIAEVMYKFGCTHTLDFHLILYVPHRKCSEICFPLPLISYIELRYMSRREMQPIINQIEQEMVSRRNIWRP